MYDTRNNLSSQVVADVREFMGKKVYDTIIPRNVRISEAPSYGKPVLVYDLKCVGSEAYLRLATEVIQRERELMGQATVAAAADRRGPQFPSCLDEAEVRETTFGNVTNSGWRKNRRVRDWGEVSPP